MRFINYENNISFVIETKNKSLGIEKKQNLNEDRYSLLKLIIMTRKQIIS